MEQIPETDQLPDFVWAPGHVAFNTPAAYEWLKANVPAPWHLFVERAEFFADSLYGEPGPHVRISRFATDEDGHRFVCGVGAGKGDSHAARHAPRAFKLAALPPEDLR